jgi:hypothetical protein
MALIFGVIFLLAGASGFFMLDRTHTPDQSLTMTHGFGHAMGLLPVNTLHNVVHLLFGLWGVLASRSYGGSRTYFRAVAIIYLLLAVMGLVPALNTTFGLVPIYGNDVWFHALLAAAAAYFGWVHRDAAGDRA